MVRKTRTASGHDNTSLLEELTPQPFVSGVKAIAYFYGGDGQQYKPEDASKYVVLQYSSLSGDQFETLMLQIGLYTDAIESAEVTIYTRYTRTIFLNYNGIVHRPIVDEDYKWITGDMVKDLKITVSDLEQI